MATKKKATGTGIPAVFPPATMEEIALARIINDDWNFYFAKTKFAFDLEVMKKVKPAQVALNAQRAALFICMQRWCIAKKVEVRFWTFALFAGRSWRFPPGLTLGTVCSEKILAKLPRIRDKDVLRARLGESALVADKEEGTKIPQHELVPQTEALKLRYAESGQAGRCITEIFTSTGGFHPKSPVCNDCAFRQACAVKLAAAHPYDIIGARNGK